MAGIARCGSNEDPLDRFFDLSSKRLYHRTTHTLVRAKGCQRLSVPATAAREGEEAVLSSSTARSKWGLCASLDGRMSCSDQDPRDPMSRLGPVSPNQAALAPVLACFGDAPPVGAPRTRTVVISGLRWSGHLLGGLLGRARQLGRRKAGQSGGRGHFANAFCWLLAPAGWMLISASLFPSPARPSTPPPAPNEGDPGPCTQGGTPPARARPQAGLPARRRGRSGPLLRMAAARGPGAPNGGYAGGHLGS